MAKRIRDYVKYTLSELDNYTKTEGSCVRKVTNKIHLNLPPYALINIKKTIPQVLASKKIGLYDIKLQGIILDIRNIKILGETAPISFADPNVHINIEADCYVFQPHVGAIVRGIVKHMSARQIGVIIYRVFSVSIRLDNQVDKNLELNTEIEFRIRKFDLQNKLPYIEGELVAKEVVKDSYSGKKSANLKETQNNKRNTQEKSIDEILKASVDSDESSDSDVEYNQILNQSKDKSLAPKDGNQRDIKYEMQSYSKGRNMEQELKGSKEKIIGNNTTQIANKRLETNSNIKQELQDSDSSDEDALTSNLLTVRKQETSHSFKNNSSDNERDSDSSEEDKQDSNLLTAGKQEILSSASSISSLDQSTDIFANQYLDNVNSVNKSPAQSANKTLSPIKKLNNTMTDGSISSDDQDMSEKLPNVQKEISISKTFVKFLDSDNLSSENRSKQFKGHKTGQEKSSRDKASTSSHLCIKSEISSGFESNSGEKKKSKKKKRVKDDFYDSLTEIINNVKIEKVSNETMNEVEIKQEVHYESTAHNTTQSQSKKSKKRKSSLNNELAEIANEIIKSSTNSEFRKPQSRELQTKIVKQELEQNSLLDPTINKSLEKQKKKSRSTSPSLNDYIKELIIKTEREKSVEPTSSFDLTNITNKFDEISSPTEKTSKRRRTSSVQSQSEANTSNENNSISHKNSHRKKKRLELDSMCKDISENVYKKKLIEENSNISQLDDRIASVSNKKCDLNHSTEDEKTKSIIGQQTSNAKNRQSKSKEKNKKKSISSELADTIREMFLKNTNGNVASSGGEEKSVGEPKTGKRKLKF